MAPLTLWNSPFNLSASTSGMQATPIVKTLQDGSFVAVWLADTALHMRLFNADGSAKGNAAPITLAEGESNMNEPAIAVLTNGNFVVAWEDSSSLEDDSSTGIRAQIFTPEGAKVGDDFQVNSSTVDYQGEVAITALSSGGFAVAFTDALGDGDGSTTRTRVFDRNGTPLGDDDFANATVEGSQPNPAAITLNDGRYVVFYEDYSRSEDDPSLITVRGRIFKANGNPETDDDFLVADSLTEGEKVNPVAAVLADGKFVVAWIDKSEDVTGCIKAQLFSATGSKIGDAFVVSSEDVVADSPNVVALNDGGFAISYTDMVSETVQVATFSDTAEAGENTVLKPTRNWYPLDTSLAVLKDGRILVAWGEAPNPEAPEGADENATAQILDMRDQAVIFSGTAVNDQYVGTRFNDRLSGAQGNDRLWGDAGDDTLDGGAGADVLDGGAGFDVVSFASSTSGVVVSMSGGGGDVFTSIEAIVGSAHADTLTGNGSARLEGGAGNDVYHITGADQVVENAGGGTDTIHVSTSYALSATVDIEVLRAANTSSSASINLTGNAIANTIIGNAGKNILTGQSGNDKLWGGLGNDTLYGGTGKDIFVFNTKLNKKTNLDKIADFSVKDDSVWLDNAIFKKLGKGTELKPGKLAKAFLTIGSKAKDKDDYLVYDSKKGVLFYDADGAGAGKAVEIANLKKGLKLTAADFFVI